MAYSRDLRGLRLYVTTESPSDELKVLVNFILKSYMPVGFEIKVGKTFTVGPVHLYRYIETSRYLPDNLKQVVDPVIERNAFFAHNDNLLFAMIFGKRTYLRELGPRRVLKD